MRSEVKTFIELFFNYDDADLWLERHLEEHNPLEWEISDLEIKLMPSGAYRAGVVFKRLFKED